MYAELVRLNTAENGPHFDSWKNDFIMIMKHSILNLDEECLMAKDGNVAVVGDKLKNLEA